MSMSQIWVSSADRDEIEFRLLNLQTVTISLVERPCLFAIVNHIPKPQMNTFYHHHLHLSHIQTMSSSRTLSALGRSRPACRAITRSTKSHTPFAATFSTSSQRQATSQGPPPPGFRLPKPMEARERKDSVWDQAANYFLLTEMARGMWVLLEQFFRPP